MQRLVVASVLLLSVIGTCFAIRCYQCTTADKNCVNPVSSMDTACSDTTAANNVCFKTAITASGSTMGIARGCGRPVGSEGLGMNECKEISIQNVKTNVCLCNSKDLCNSAGSFKISISTIGVFALLAMILTKFL